MKSLMDYVRLILFVCGVLLGVQVPAFVDQYGQQLQAHTMEAKLSLSAFKRDAERFFDGDINKLIDHYRQNPDTVINAGGDNIESLYQRYQLLQGALQRFNQSPYSGFQQVMFEPLGDIRDQVWQQFSHTIILDRRAIAIGLLLGLLFALLCEVLLVLLLKGVRRTYRIAVPKRRASR